MGPVAVMLRTGIIKPACKIHAILPLFTEIPHSIADLLASLWQILQGLCYQTATKTSTLKTVCRKFQQTALASVCIVNAFKPTQAWGLENNWMERPFNLNFCHFITKHKIQKYYFIFVMTDHRPLSLYENKTASQLCALRYPKIIK